MKAGPHTTTEIVDAETLSDGEKIVAPVAVVEEVVEDNKDEGRLDSSVDVSWDIKD